MTIYLIDEPFAPIGLAYAENDPGARIVLLQDAVHVGQRNHMKGMVYAVADDVARRGLADSIDPSVKIIGYDELVEMMEGDRVVCFL